MAERVGSAQLIAGKYRLLSLLGRGGMGSVWRAHDIDLDAPVAVKLLEPGIALSSEGLARFHREAEAAAAIRSPHVVQIFARGIDEASGSPFIAMELLDGESLAERLKRTGRLDPGQTAWVLTHVARALARAHEAGIVHRDLKPDNVFLVRNDDEELAKVLDFGIAKFDKHPGDSGTRTGAVMGTPYYMSPEQIRGSKEVDFRTDIWALGVIACECLTGQRPFAAESHGELALKICVEPLPLPRELGDCPPNFDAWFQRTVARDPSQRFGSVREAAGELRRALGVVDAPGALESPGDRPLRNEAATVSTSPFTQTAKAPPDGVESRFRFGSWWVAAGVVAALGITVALWNARSVSVSTPSVPSAPTSRDTPAQALAKPTRRAASPAVPTEAAVPATTSAPNMAPSAVPPQERVRSSKRWTPAVRQPVRPEAHHELLADAMVTRPIPSAAPTPTADPREPSTASAIGRALDSRE